MFRGIAAVNMDGKGRLAVPMRYRETLEQECEGQLVLTIDTKAPCLLLYTLPVWRDIEKKLQKLPSFNSAARRIQRLLIGHATELDMDKNGRFLVPPLLREYSSLLKDVVLVGLGNKFEVWDKEQWSDGRSQWLEEERLETEIPEDLQQLSL